MGLKEIRRHARDVFLLVLVVALLFYLSPGMPSFASGGLPVGRTIRIGLYHGVLSLAAPQVHYMGPVGFYVENLLGETIQLANDSTSRWTIRRESVTLAAGPYMSMQHAEQMLTLWPAAVAPAHVSSEVDGFYVVGGNFFSADQAWLSLSAVTMAGFGNARVRGAHHLRTMPLASREEAEMLAQTLRTAGLPGARVGYDGSYRVAIGYETDLPGLSSLQQRVSAVAPGLVLEYVTPTFRRVDVVRDDGRWLFSYENLAGMAMRVAPLDGGIMRVENIQHRGVYEFLLDAQQRFTVISIMDVEDYLKGVVPREMPSLWHIEALKAQAVVARTYTQATRGKHASAGFDLCTFSTCCQAYGGVDWEHPHSSAAIEATRGVMLFANGRPAATFYHSDSGGHTEANSNVWNGSPISYLAGVPDPYPVMAGSPHATWSTSLSQADLQRTLANNSVNVGSILKLEVKERTPGGRVAVLIVHGSLGRAELIRQQPRLPDVLASSYELRSTKYSVTNRIATTLHITDGENMHTQASWDGLAVLSASGQASLPLSASYILHGQNGPVAISSQTVAFVFDGSGWGHGVGLSQWGARGMAEQGYTYQNILLHYYQGVELVQIAP